MGRHTNPVPSLVKICTLCSLPRGSSTEYTEGQAFSQVVRIGSPRTLSPQLVLPYPPCSKGGGRIVRLWERGRGELIRTKGQTLWYSRYSIIPLRVAPCGRSGGPHWRLAVSPYSRIVSWDHLKFTNSGSGTKWRNIGREASHLLL